jgi:type IV pilus assembly protein PilV
MHRQRGFSLIELSVATAIYSMGLGSVSLLLLLAVHGTAGARLDTVAVMHAASLAEMIAMNSDAIGHYAFHSGAGPCDDGQSCSTDEVAATNLATWQARLAQDLPRGNGLLCRDSTPDDGDGDDPACDGYGGPVVKVFWETPADSADRDSEPDRQVSRLPLP